MISPAADVRRIFALACELTGEARAACLLQECSGDEVLRAAVERLLRSDAEPRLLGEAGIARVREQLVPGAEPLPERIGEFRVLDVLGRGGMGVVYRARQDHPAREVALKVLAPHRGGAAARARFALEAEALGRLQHAGIAQIFAAGTYRSAGGEQPFLAMELVAGVPLLTWVHGSRPSLAARITLLVQLAEAVHHAHQKGLIHRDLKPGNVLVDVAGRPKVLDFGIARLVDDDREQTLHTRTGELLGTLAYMSPEQASGRGERVDVRTDVYALGAIAYELFTGVPAIDVSTDELLAGLRRIAEEEPRALGDRDRTLRGDLQTIVAMAMRKEPERRYDSAQAFADDLRRFLAHEPIRARPATATYVLRRFARRHRGLVIGAAVATMALLGGTVVSVSWALQADRARRDAKSESRIAAQVATFVTGLFRAAAPKVSLGKEISAKDLVLAGKANIQRDLAGEPVLKAQLGGFLGSVLSEMGDQAAALPLLQEAVDRQRQALAGHDHARLAENLRALGNAQYRTGAFAVAMGPLQEALAMQQRSIHDAFEIGGCLLALAACERDQRRFAESHAMLEQAITAFGGIGRDDQIALCMVEIANQQQLQGQFDAAETWFLRAMDLLQHLDEPMVSAAVATNLGTLRVSQNRLSEAGELFRRALADGERYLGPEHPLLIRRLCNLAGVTAQGGDLEEAGELLERALAIGKSVDASYDDGVANACNNLANVRVLQERFDDAITLFEQCATILVRRHGQDSREVGAVYECIAAACDAVGREGPAAQYRAKAKAIGARQ